MSRLAGDMKGFVVLGVYRSTVKKQNKNTAMNFALCHEEGPRKPERDETEWTTTSGPRNLCSFIG